MKRNLLRLFILSVMSIFALGASATPDKDYLCFTANTAGSKVALWKFNSPAAVSLQASTDGATWSDYTLEQDITLANKGDKVYFRKADEGVATQFSTSSTNYYYFVMSGSIAASGNVMSLIDNTCTATTIPNSYCFNYLFDVCESLTTAPEFPATILKSYCYQYMFNGCTGLTTAPELPATTLTSYCYQYMFNGCTGLTTAPELPATILQSYCYRRMFSGCSSLTTAPELPAITLKGYCYSNMFNGCTNLNNISVAFTEFTSNCTSSWVTSTSSSGTFACPSTLDTSTPDKGKNPSDWNVKNSFDLTITGAGWASMCVNLPLYIPIGAGAEVYYASAVSGSQITLTRIEEGTTIAAKTAVLVKGAEGTASFPIMGEAGTSYTDNLFAGTSVDKPFNAEKDGAVYVLSGVGSTIGNPQFKNYIGTTLGAHKIWLPKSAVGGSTGAINFVFDDATAINGMDAATPKSSVRYNLNGQAVGADYKGIVIVNGKKYINK